MKHLVAPLAAVVLLLLTAGIVFAQASTTTTAVVLSNANLRDGPGTTYAIAGSARAGDVVTIVDQNAAGDWYKLDNNKWIAAFLVAVDQPTAAARPNTPALATATALPARRTGATVATPTPKAVASAVPAPAGAPAVQLVIVENHSTAEILAIRNGGSAALNIGGWQLDGSKGTDLCVIPSGTVLAPGADYQIATGDSQPQGGGLKCGDKPIWNNGGETIYLRGPGGLILSIESERR